MPRLPAVAAEPSRGRNCRWLLPFARVAQLVEQRTHKPLVGGSSPSPGTSFPAGPEQFRALPASEGGRVSSDPHRGPVSQKLAAGPIHGSTSCTADRSSPKSVDDLPIGRRQNRSHSNRLASPEAPPTQPVHSPRQSPPAGKARCEVPRLKSRPLHITTEQDGPFADSRHAAPAEQGRTRPLQARTGLNHTGWPRAPIRPFAQPPVRPRPWLKRLCQPPCHNRLSALVLCAPWPELVIGNPPVPEHDWC